MMRRPAKVIAITLVDPGVGQLGQLRVVGPGGESTWAVNLSNWRIVIATAADAVTAELGHALGEIRDASSGDRLRRIANFKEQS